METVELKLYDLHFQYRKKTSVSPEVVIAAIDQKSIDELGRWPWSRSKIKTLIEKLNQAGAKVIAFDVTFPSAEKNLLAEYYREYHTLLPSQPEESASASAPRQEVERFLRHFQPDLDLSQALQKAGNVILGMFFILSPEEIKARGKACSSNQPSFLPSQAYQYVEQPKGEQPTPSISSPCLPRAYGFEASLDLLAQSAAANGFFNMYPDIDGVIRWSPLIIEYQGHWYPSLDIQVIKHYWELPDEAIHIQLGTSGLESFTMEGIPIPLDERGHVLINYQGPDKTFPQYSIADILAKRVPVESIRDKIVLVGATATGIYDLRYTPFKIMSGVEIHASIINTILNMDFLYLPPDHVLIELLILLCFGLWLGILLPFCRPMIGAAATSLMMMGYLGLNHFLFTSKGIWVTLFYPMIEITTIFIILSLYRYSTEEREKKRIKNSFEHYLAPDLVQELIQHPEKLRLGGEKKVLTVLFSDIRGFTSISEKLTPEALVSFLNEYMSRMSTIILKHSGFLDKFIGDAIMAVYCAPIFREDHALLACRAALEMRQALVQVNQRCQEQNLTSIKIGIGINSGEMIIGNVGSNQRLDYTVLGDNVNLASRLEGITKVYGVDIVVSEYTEGFIKDKFWLRELDLVRVKGKNRPVKIFQLAGEKAEAQGFEPLLTCYNQGLQAFRNRRWQEATGFFEQALLIDPQDGPSHYYLERCRQCQNAPPPSDWDGVSTFTTK